MRLLLAFVARHRLTRRYRRRFLLVRLMLPEFKVVARRGRAVRGAPRITGPIGTGSDPARGTPVPILMFHAIAPAPAGAPWPGLYLRPDRFQSQMRELAAGGFDAVTLSTLYGHWSTGIALPPKPLVISFDDGHRSVHAEALPVLAELGWPAVLNLDLQHLCRSDGVRAPMVRELVGAGWELGCHTITHPDLTELVGRDLDEEVTLARRLLRTMFGVGVNFFCYPSGRHDGHVVEVVRAAGYLGATTTRPGLAFPTEPFRLRRVRVGGADDAQVLSAQLQALLSQSRHALAPG